MCECKNIFLLSLLLLLPALTGCDKNTTGPKPDKTADSDSDSLSTLVVIFEDDKGNPVDYNSSLYNPLGLFRTDGIEFAKQYMFQNGRAHIDSLPAGSYSVVFNFYDYNEYMSIYYANDVVVKEHQINETRFILPSEVEYHIFLVSRDYFTKDKETEKYVIVPIPDAVITTEPETVTVTTDAQGHANLGTYPLQNFRYIITKRKTTFTDFFPTMYITNGKFELVISIGDYMSLVEIISPSDNEYLPSKNVHLIGDGCYITGEPLSDDNFNWYSDIDGTLGKGREIILKSLSLGHHTITLYSLYGLQRSSVHSIGINVFFFDEESYFPLPYNGYWDYRYQTTDFSVTDDTGGIEYWTINDLQVSANDVNTRNCLMEYAITKGNTTKYCRYYVVDYYEIFRENICVTKTTEQVLIFDDENRQNEPIEQLEVETAYKPRYLLIKEYMDPATESSYETSVPSVVTWEYRHGNSRSLSFTETMNIETSYEIGETETVETEIGTFEAVPLTIFTGDTVRKWWLAKGIGIIQLEYDTFDFPLTATLYDTNIFSFSEDSQAKKSISNSFYNGGSHLRKVLKSPPDTPERMLELCRLLRGLCPR